MTKTEKLAAKIAEADKRITAEQNKAQTLKNDLEKLEEKKLQLLIGSSRASDSRRKFLAGSWLLCEIEKDEKMRERLNQGLEIYLTRPDDRRLFKLTEKLPVATMSLKPIIDELKNQSS